MVNLSSYAKNLLVTTNIDPLKVAQMYGVSETECWDYITDYNRTLDAAERSYNARSVAKQVQEWISTISEAKALRMAALREKLLDAKEHPEKYDIKRLLLEKDLLLGKITGVTIEQIERAKAYPISTILSVTRKGNVSCPFHKDKTPSLQIKKNNTFTCYSCQRYGDSIDLYKEMHNKTFIEAVRALCG